MSSHTYVYASPALDGESTASGAGHNVRQTEVGLFVKFDVYRAIDRELVISAKWLLFMALHLVLGPGF